MSSNHASPGWAVLADGLAFPEGPAFAPDGRLWGVELDAGRLFVLDGPTTTFIDVGGQPNGLAFDADRPVYCDASGHRVVKLQADGTREIIVDASGRTPFERPNDLAFDPRGNLVFTAPGSSRTVPNGTIWCLDVEGRLTCVADDLYFPNGLAFSPDGQDLVVAETYRQRLWRGQWDAAERRWVNPKPWVPIGGPIGPDGMAFAHDGRLFVAAFGLGLIKVIDPSGVTCESLEVPGMRPTNVAIDPAGQLGLVVTEAEHGRLLSLPLPDLRPCLFNPVA